MSHLPARRDGAASLSGSGRPVAPSSAVRSALGSGGLDNWISEENDNDAYKIAGEGGVDADDAGAPDHNR